MDNIHKLVTSDVVHTDMNEKKCIFSNRKIAKIYGNFGKTGIIPGS